ncbi:MAG: heme ABC exporter ATP-binding protein CcmA [Candidatus Latescibacterota bacterium]|nr:MAG: heme ABC exporter ATP-binding protein CcmA [Candidatus Latescibacterota bacterium]
MPGEPGLLAARDITKSFGRFKALRSVSLDLAAGEFLTIFGRNGAGKTTFLKIVSSIIRTYSGSVILFGSDLKRADDDTRRRIGFVSHESLLYKDLSVYDNLMFYARLYRVQSPGQRIAEMIARVDLEAKTTVPVRALSRGMRQRLALARAFIHGPELLLLDEPFTGLDERASEILDGFLDEFVKHGGSVVMVTHDIDRGWRHAHRVAVLDRGAVVYETPAAESSADAFRDKYHEILRS